MVVGWKSLELKRELRERHKCWGHHHIGHLKLYLVRSIRQKSFENRAVESPSIKRRGKMMDSSREQTQKSQWSKWTTRRKSYKANKVLQG